MYGRLLRFLFDLSLISGPRALLANVSFVFAAIRGDSDALGV